MRKLLSVPALVATLGASSCRSEVYVYDERTATTMPLSRYYELYPEEDPENTATITIIIQ